MGGVITTLVCPLFGVLICCAMGFAPIPALLEARRNRNLGDIQPIPFAMLCNAQLGWTIYGCMKRDYWVFFSSCIPLLTACVLVSTAIHLLEREGHTELENLIRVRVELVLFASTVLWLFLSFIACLVIPPEQRDTGTTMIGAFTVCSSLIFYAAPLINMREIIKSKDSSSLYPPALVVNLINCTLWFFYGLLGTGAVILWLPNIIGGSICIAELIVCVRYPAKAHFQKEERRKSMQLAGKTMEEIASDDLHRASEKGSNVGGGDDFDKVPGTCVCMEN